MEKTNEQAAIKANYSKATRGENENRVESQRAQRRRLTAIFRECLSK